MSDHLIVRTQCGPVRGHQKATLFGDDYYRFCGIPYASPPINHLRFRDPQPPSPWTEPLDVTGSVISAPRVDSVGQLLPSSSEDCLQLNVFTKSVASHLPVMVWIHGGSFKHGSSSDHTYAPDYLLRHDIVLVTVNYRLGALGFLSLDNPAAGVPGNAGLKDQSLALRWVRENIAGFGGDAQNVTVFGNSAGGCSVHLHMLSPHSAGLFDKAISQSGTGLAEWANYPRNDWTRRLALRLGWSEEGDDELMLQFLQQADVAAIVREQDAILNREERMDGISAFGPAQEPYVAEQCFMPDAPEKLLEKAWSSNVPLIVGGNSDEGLLFYRIIAKAPQLFQSLGGFERLVPLALGVKRGSSRSEQLAKQIRDYYYDEEEPTAENITRSLQIWGDKIFWHGIGGTVRSRKSIGAKTYLYRFAVQSKWFQWHKRKYVGDADVQGTSHVDEVVYLFKHPEIQQPMPESSAEWNTIKLLTGMWTRFAATGNPNPIGGDLASWEDANSPDNTLKCLNIAEELSFVDLPEETRINFWDQLYVVNNIPE